MVKIFSIKSEFSDKIYDRQKKVELRRQDVKVDVNEKCLIYTTAPVKKITGYFIVEKKIRLPLRSLWEITKDIAGVTKSQFQNYFQGCKEGTAIFFKIVKKFQKVISLEDVKRHSYNFKPPQSYCNISVKLYYTLIQEIGEKPVTTSFF